jgi:hypothetical protein
LRHITSSTDPGALTVSGDVADPETGARLVDRAVERFGRVDALVNNAGVFVAKPFTEYTDDDFDLITGVSLPAPLSRPRSRRWPKAASTPLPGRSRSNTPPVAKAPATDRPPRERDH